MRFDVLSRDLNVFEPHFLEASAGTGKTFAIEHLVVRLLIEGESPLSIDQILVVTFTRAATRELKMRIRRNLFRTKEELAAGNPTTDYLKALCEKGDEASKAALQRIDAALICYDAAQIYTLHGFCHRVLKEFAFEAQVGFECSDPDDNEHLILLEQMVKDHLKEGVSSPDYSPFQIRSLLKQHRRNPRRMISRLVTVVSGGKEIARLPTHHEALQAFLKELQELPEIEASSFKADLALLVPQYKEMTGEEVQTQIGLLSEVLSSKSCTPMQFDRLLDGELFLEKMHEGNKKQRAKFPDPSALHYPDLIETLRRRLLGHILSARDSSQTFLRLAGDLMHKSRELLEKHEKFSPDALLLKVEEALKMPRFVERVRQKYRAAIVDEFQDTDPVQWNIFQKLFISHIDTVCLVGDPKQSIYAFRNADVYVYLEAAKAMGDRAKKYLDTNFRSTAPLVDALNLLFSKAQGLWMDMPGREAPLDVIPVKSGAKLLAKEGDAPVQFFVASGKKGRSRKFPTDELMEKKVFPFIASEIFELHSKMGVEYHDMAILIKDRFQGQALIGYLQESGIPASSKRGASILDSAAYEAVRELLAAVLAPFDTSKLKAALGGPFIAWDDTLLSRGLQDSALLNAKAKFQFLSDTLFEWGYGPFLQKFLKSSWGDSEATLLQEMLQRGDLPLVLDLRKISELLIEEEMSRGLKGASLLKFLEEIVHDADEVRLKAPPQEEKGSVAVMTTHMSKGLEFEVVFALGLASRHKPSEQIVVKKEGKSWMTPFDAEDPLCQRTIAESDAEKMRQLYVALTRAKRRLYVPLLLEEESKGIELGEASPIELFFAKMARPSQDQRELYQITKELDLSAASAILDGLSPLIRYRVLEEAQLSPRAQPSSPDLQLDPPALLELPKYETQVLSFTALAKKGQHLEMVQPPSDAPMSSHTLPLGSETGHLLHLLFEKIFKRGLHHAADEGALLQLINEEIAFSRLDEWRPVLLPWIVSLLKKPLQGFSLSDVPRRQLQQEMEFFYPLENGAMKGFADLLFEFGGKYYILDWKSNYLGPDDGEYTLEKIQEAMHQNQYYLQASIYAEALRRYVKLFDSRPFAECFGGAIYYFVRGGVPYLFTPECDARQ